LPQAQNSFVGGLESSILLCYAMFHGVKLDKGGEQHDGHTRRE
jgi:hypothetical protein